MERGGRPEVSNHVDGGVLGHSVQAGLIQGGVHFHATPAPAAAADPATVGPWDAPHQPEVRAVVRGP
ncbi:hypothetical protein ACFV4N_09900, partial [Actinosynnema sp. NPDC059797]